MQKPVLIGIALVPAVLILGLFGFAATKPDTFKVERHTTIHATPDKVAAQLTDFHKWQAWSPWEGLDPNMKRTFEGPATGKGAVYAWDGNDKAGAGRMEIKDVRPDAVELDLGFIKPFESHANVVFGLKPAGDQTEVTWTMSGPSPFISKVMQCFCSMDALIGKDFEKGLAQLKAQSEK